MNQTDGRSDVHFENIYQEDRKYSGDLSQEINIENFYFSLEQS